VSGVLLESRVKGPDDSRIWMSGYTRDYQRVLVPVKENELTALQNSLIDAMVSRWVVDRASGEVSWIGEVKHV
jgi:hypothetical protein